MSNRKKRMKLHEVPLEQDIRYRGPLSYRHFRILGWLCIGLSQICVILTLATHFSEEIAEKFSLLIPVLSRVATLSVPLLLLASFAVILGSGRGYKIQLLTMGGAAVGVILLFELFFFRYFIGVLEHLTGNSGKVRELIDKVLSEGSASHFLAFNIFIDVVLCILFMYFLNYRPVKSFQGKKLIIFRLFALLPVLYEATSLVLKICSVDGLIKIPAALFPFLTTKPPIMFLVFMVLAYYIKKRERLFYKGGRTSEEYQAFLKTNRNSWHFSCFTSLVLVVAGILDLLITITIILVYMSKQMDLTNTGNLISAEMVVPYLNIASDMGFGKSIILIPLAPLVLLFSYNRSYKNFLIDILIPLAGIVLVIFIYLEAIYYGSGLATSVFSG